MSSHSTEIQSAPAGQGDDPTAQRILKSAADSFARVGFDATRLAHVASDAGVSRPTVYARYSDKVALFRAALANVFAISLGNVHAAVARQGKLDVILGEALQAYYGALFDQFHGLDTMPELIAAQAAHAQDIVDGATGTMRKELQRVLIEHRHRCEGASGEELPTDELVDLLMLAPLSFKLPGTTKAQYQRRLQSLAMTVALAVA